jgi:ligand-binding sensor domain-containing protein/two-component sensor histidine kinase
MLIFHIASAQEPVYRHFTNQNGLPSSEVYDVLQSKEGYIWFATNYGVVRFDGLNFRVFDKQDGLPENAVFNMQKDPSGRIWFNAFNGSLAYWDGKQIKPYKNNKQLSAYISSQGLTTTVFVSYDIQRDGSILFDLFGKGRHRVTVDGVITCEKRTEDAQFFDLTLLENGRVLFNSPINTTVPTLRIVRGDSITVVNNDIAVKDFVVSKLFRAIHYQDKVYFSYNNLVMQICEDSSKNIYSFDYRILSIKIDKLGRLWVGTINGGIFMFDDLNLNTEPVNYLQGNSISNIYFDHEDGIWLTSTNNGVFYYPTLNISKLMIETGLPSSRIIDIEIEPSGKIWLGLDRGHLLTISKDHANKMYQIDSKNECEISCIKWDDDQKKLFIGTSTDLYYSKNEIIRPHPYNDKSDIRHKTTRFSAVKDIAQDEKTGDYWMGKYSGISNLTHNGDVTFISKKENGFDERIEAVEVDDNGTIWLGSLRGLWQFKDSAFVHLDTLSPLLGERISAIKSMHDTLILGTRGNGLILLTKDSIYQFTSQHGLAGNSINALEIGQGFIFAGSNLGVSAIERKTLASNPKIINITASSGLTSNEITSLFLQDDLVYVGTSGGLNVFNLASLQPPKNFFPLLITRMTVNETEVDMQQNLEIEFENNAIEIDYFAISFRNKGKITYRYRLVGIHDDWIENQRTNVQFPYLPPGKYIFEVTSRNLNGEWNPEPTTLAFVVLKPYWQTWWFISLIILFTISILWTWYLLRVRAIKQKNKLLQDIYKYQQEALIGQMNPHFLFNALNTVQRYILENDKIASSRYLSRFAGLMRKTLENSQNKTISVQAEIEALNLYLELEVARYKDKFDFEIVAEPGFNPFTSKIPVFIIQPLVENAIWHGLMTSKRHGKLKVIFVKEHDELICKVIDNGIGREEASKLKNQDDKKSMGTSIIQKRLNLLNLHEKQHIQIKYIDLTDESGLAQGTEVVINFPLIINPAV